MPKTIPAKRISAVERREAILAAATEVFAELGYERASIRRIASAAGITIPVIYDHFASKQELQVTLLERAGDELIAAVVNESAAATAEQLLRASVATFFAFVEQRPYAWRTLFRELPADSEVAAARARVMERAAREIAGLFALSPGWRREGSIASDSAGEALAMAVRSAINGLAEWWWENREVPREEVVALAVDLLWPGIDRLREEQR